MGRKKLWDTRILLPMTAETLAQIDASLGEIDGFDETRLDLIREAIERELKRRKRARPTFP